MTAYYAQIEVNDNIVKYQVPHGQEPLSAAQQHAAAIGGTVVAYWVNNPSVGVDLTANQAKLLKKWFSKDVNQHSRLFSFQERQAARQLVKKGILAEVHLRPFNDPLNPWYRLK